MVNHNNEAVLIDFGVSALINETDRQLIERNMGSYMMYAPEIFDHKNRNYSQTSGERIDLWALGITVYYLLTGRFPCEDARCPITLRDLILNRPINFDLIKNRAAK